MSKTSFFLMAIFLISLGTLLSLNAMYGSNNVLNSFPAIFPTQAEIPSENTLSLSPSDMIVPVGKTSNVQVVIDSKGAPPSVIQMELAYDPGVIGHVKVTPGTYFSNPQVLLNTIKNGRISYALAPSPDQPTPTTSSVVATIAITPLTAAYKRQTTLYFLPKTVVKTKTTDNTLKIAYGTKITLGSGYIPLASPSGQVINY